MYLCFLKFHVYGILHYELFLNSNPQSTIILRFIHVARISAHCFLLLSGILLYVYISPYLSIPQLMDIWLFLVWGCYKESCYGYRFYFFISFCRWGNQGQECVNCLKATELINGSSICRLRYCRSRDQAFIPFLYLRKVSNVNKNWDNRIMHTHGSVFQLQQVCCGHII